jgi:signal transduction protein with GAF and PtsI domain
MPTSTSPQALTALRAIARALSAASDLDSSLDLIARQTTEVMGVDSCTIYLLDPDGETLRLRATTGLARRALGRATLKVGEGMTGYAVQSGQPVYAAEAHRDPHFKQVEEAEEMVFQSLLAVPLVIEERPIGALNIQTISPRRYEENEVELLSLIGDLAAGALAKAQLYDNQRRQLEELRALAQVSEAVTSPEYLGTILDLVTGMAARVMGAAVCSIFLIDESGRYLVLHSAQRTSSPHPGLPGPPLLVGEGVIGRVAASGRPAYVRDVGDDPIYRRGELARAEGLVSLLAVPLMVRDRVIGVFNCYTAEERVFSEEQQALLMTLANQTALSIENAQLATNAAVIREMHHRIKNNLQTVAMLMRLQLAEAGKLDARAVLETSIHRVHSIAAVHEILSERGFELVDVKAVLERIMRPLVETLAAHLVTISVEGETFLLPTRAATSLALVVNELAQNALDHAFREQAAGHVQIALGRSAAELIVLVRDNGVGFPADSQRGLGLEIVETLVNEDLHGRIKFNRPSGGGTEVSIRMPRTIEREYGQD